MQDDADDAGSSPTQTREEAILQQELERRLAILDSMDDAEFGRFTSLDWFLTTLLFVIIPLLVAWWGA